MPARAGARAAAVLAAAAAFALPQVAAGPARAADMPQGEFYWTGDQGNGSDDEGHWYGPYQGDTIDATASADHRTIQVSVNRLCDSWTLDLAAPAGGTLAPGTYTDAPFIKSERLKVFGSVLATDPDLGTTVVAQADQWVKLS